MPRRQPPDVHILDLIHNEAWDDVAAAFSTCHPADIADFIDRAPRDTHEQLFSLINDRDKPDVLAEVESVTKSEVLESLSNSEISDIVEDMAPDNAADVLADLPKKRSEQVLALMEKNESEDVRRLLTYPEDTAGGIMTTDVVAMHEDQTVEEALKEIAYLDTHEPFYNANIVDANRKLIGYIDVWELLRERDRNRPLGELVHKQFTATTVDTDQEEVARLMSKYDLDALPVVDSEGRLVGRVTADDAIDVMEEEASEDIFRLAGSDDAELEGVSAMKSCWVRLPWLFITLLGGFVVVYLLNQFLAHVAHTMILAAFVPVVLAMGGNTGVQSSTLIVRSIALGDLKGKNLFKLLLREMMVGAVMGCICGVIIGLGAHAYIAMSMPTDGILPPVYLATIIAIALFCAMTFAAMFGTLVPILLNKLRIDPAVASGPFITITKDISALLLYFAVTVLLFNRFA